MIIDNAIGIGDVILMFVTGITLAPEQMLIFFTISFVFSAFITLVFLKQNSTVPLAGTMALCYTFFLPFSNKFSLTIFNFFT